MKCPRHTLDGDPKLRLHIAEGAGLVFDTCFYYAHFQLFMKQKSPDTAGASIFIFHKKANQKSPMGWDSGRWGTGEEPFEDMNDYKFTRCSKAGVGGGYHGVRYSWQ